MPVAESDVEKRQGAIGGYARPSTWMTMTTGSAEHAATRSFINDLAQRSRSTGGSCRE